MKSLDNTIFIYFRFVVSIKLSSKYTSDPAAYPNVKQCYAFIVLLNKCLRYIIITCKNGAHTPEMKILKAV